MSEPKVLDANGKPLAVGARVRTTYDGSEGTFGEPRWWPGEGWSATVFFVPGSVSREPIEPGERANTYRCPDLTPINQYDKEESDGP